MESSRHTPPKLSRRQAVMVGYSAEDTYRRFKGPAEARKMTSQAPVSSKTPGRTYKMRLVEQRFGKPIERVLQDMVIEHGKREASKRMGISPITVSLWMMQLGMEDHTIILNPGERAIIKREGADDQVIIHSFTPTTPSD